LFPLFLLCLTLWALLASGRQTMGGRPSGYA
jgi:hypothetical protein